MSSPILFAIACLIWGSTFWAITLQLGDIAPAVSIVYRFGLASATLFTWCLLRGDRLLLPWKAQRWVMLQGVATFAISYVCTYTSEQYLVSALVAVLFVLMVFWTPVCNRFMFGTPLTSRMWSAAAVSICGVVLLFYEAIHAAWTDIVSGGSGHFLLGLGLALFATLASTIGNVVVVKVRQESSNVLLTMAWAMFWGAVAVASWALLNGQEFRLPSGGRYWAGLLYLSLFGSVIAFAAYFTLIHRIGSQKAVYIVVVTPVISVLLSIQLEHYRPGAMEWLGMVLCLSSVAWALKTPSSANTTTLESNLEAS
ncbi:EamA family transporter [Pseudoduganella sp. LjRoot289]|uniref:DMT family transporter n=1 Tax=Pseudoduganella sp. LjRoot289 TaxID=3342314 RepID=UPI003ECEB298